MKTVRDFDVKNKRVLVRCDFNVPLDDEGNILDDFKIKATLPTIEYLISKQAKIILMSHLDNPEGKIVERFRLDVVQERLIMLLNRGIKEKPVGVLKADDCVGENIENLTETIQPGEILLLENLRFHSEEEKNDKVFSESLAKLGDIYINDAFAESHRPYASMIGVAKKLPRGAGFLLEKELKILGDFMKKSKKPLIAIIGGKKVGTKVRFINKISEKADYVLIGGPIKGEIENKNIKFKNPKKIIEQLEDPEEKDIYEKTIEIFTEKIKIAKTIFWNGPLGQIEKDEYQNGTKKIIEAIIESGAFSVVGGGETIEFINKLGLSAKFNHVSTGGGAMLAYLSGEKLPGVEALR